MGREMFDGLRVLRVEWESENGRAELCLARDSARWVRLRAAPPACQRELLAALGERAPARLEGGALELLLPWREGVPLGQWLYERCPGLGGRREACLSLLADLLDSGWPPCLTVLSAREENLCFGGQGACLRPLPELARWEPGITERQAVCAAAGLACAVMVRGAGRLQRRFFPAELRALYRRTQERGYVSWGQLQRDVAAIPDRLPTPKEALQAAAKRAGGRLRRWGRRAAPLLTALLAAAALLSLACALREWRESRRPAPWPGIFQIGDQRLGPGEVDGG